MKRKYTQKEKEKYILKDLENHNSFKVFLCISWNITVFLISDYSKQTTLQECYFCIQLCEI